MGGIPAVVEDHVGLPVVVADTPVDAPPEVLLGLASPGEHRDVVLGQCGGDLVLRTVNVTCGPSTL